MNQTTTSTKRQRPHKDDNNTPPTNPKRNKQQPIPQQPIPQPQHDTTRICIQTSRSRLSQRPLDKSQHAMADECVAAARPLMVHRPPLGKMFGKECRQPRNVAFFSNDSIGYRYSRQLMPSQNLPEPMKRLLQHVNTVFNARFNGILVNQYVNGLDSIGRHRDDEDGLDECAGVVALTIGAGRKFRIRDNDGKIVVDVPTLSYHFLQMNGEFQKEFTHEIAVQKRVTGERWSFTFREHKE